ncbi:hypothetical protein GDO81_026992 [Engystomops pustulosus]|uniref:Uncharacterized protein n=1 Tax=Engystomops pustulosus TaxID=76066 RepID=A0AAV6YMH2_ENGPU|nr:hypothetical protein GDO81_026992 [Engystomops pustulosus]
MVSSMTLGGVSGHLQASIKRKTSRTADISQDNWKKTGQVKCGAESPGAARYLCGGGFTSYGGMGGGGAFPIDNDLPCNVLRLRSGPPHN